VPTIKEAQVRREFCEAGAGVAEIARRILRLQIPPALKGAPRLPFGRHRFRIEHKPAAPDAVLVAERPHVEQFLPHLHVAADDPVERAAAQNFLHPLRDHARGVKMLRLSAGAAGGAQALLDPVLEILDGIAADAEFQDVEGHAR
jgi:hypothetical protein